MGIFYMMNISVQGPFCSIEGSRADVLYIGKPQAVDCSTPVCNTMIKDSNKAYRRLYLVSERWRWNVNPSTPLI